MRSRLVRSALLGAAALGAISLAGAGVAQATPVVWNFDSYTGTLGTSQVYASAPALSPAENVIATGYSRNKTIDITASGTTVINTGTADLFGKNSPPTEQGVGLTNDPNGQHEISTSGFVQLDLGQLKSPPLNSSTLSFGTNSVQTASNDVWYVFGSNTAGQFDTSNVLDHGTSASTVDLSSILGTYTYLDVTTSSGNVLIKELDNSVPEPGSLALLGTGLLGLGLVARRRRRKA